MANVSVIGAGSWGLALARRLCKNGHDVTVWSHREEGVRELREQHENRKRFSIHPVWSRQSLEKICVCWQFHRYTPEAQPSR